MKSEKIPLHMYIPQTKGEKVPKLYALFRNKTLNKSKEKKSTASKNPVAMILNFNYPKMDTQMGVLVKKNSFEPILEDKIEIGFKAIVGCVFGNFTLYVYKRGKAYIER